MQRLQQYQILNDCFSITESAFPSLLSRSLPWAKAYLINDAACLILFAQSGVLVFISYSGKQFTLEPFCLSVALRYRTSSKHSPTHTRCCTLWLSVVWGGPVAGYFGALWFVHIRETKQSELFFAALFQGNNVLNVWSPCDALVLAAVLPKPVRSLHFPVLFRKKWIQHSSTSINIRVLNPVARVKHQHTVLLNIRYCYCAALS